MSEDDREAADELGLLIRDIYREHGMYTPDQKVADLLIGAGYRKVAQPSEPSQAPAGGAQTTGAFYASDPESAPGEHIVPPAGPPTVEQIIERMGSLSSGAIEWIIAAGQKHQDERFADGVFE